MENISFILSIIAGLLAIGWLIYEKSKRPEDQNIKIILIVAVPMLIITQLIKPVIDYSESEIKKPASLQDISIVLDSDLKHLNKSNYSGQV